MELTQQTRVNSSYEARTHGGKVRGTYLGARLLPAHAASTHDDQAQAGFQADAHHRARAALLKKPMEAVGKQINVPGSFWQGRMTDEERQTLYRCTVRDFTLASAD